MVKTGTERNRRLLMLFALYVLLLPVFGIVYYSMYRSRPDNFAFNADVRDARLSELRSARQSQVAELQTELEAVRYLSAELQKRQDPLPVEDAELGWSVAHLQTDQFEYQFEFSPLWKVQGEQPSKEHILTIWDSEKRKISWQIVGLSREPVSRADPTRFQAAIESLNPPYSKEDYLQMLSPLIRRLEQQAARESEAAAGIGPRSAGSWSYVDFVYFATITQTTVGYGDILPNSTVVRVVVIIQVVLGLLIAVFFVNTVVPVPVGDGPA